MTAAAIACAGGAVWALDGGDASSPRSTGEGGRSGGEPRSHVQPGADPPAVPQVRGRGAAHVAQPAPSQVDSQPPSAVQFPSGTTVSIRRVSTLPSGELEIPSDINRAGWWDGGSKLGDPFGRVVVAAHIDSFTQGLGRFDELLSLHPGELIRLGSPALSQQYRVTSARLVAKARLSSSSPVYSARGPNRLVLITCGGKYYPERGGYQSNLVVVAKPIGTLRRG